MRAFLKRAFSAAAALSLAASYNGTLGFSELSTFADEGVSRGYALSQPVFALDVRGADCAMELVPQVRAFTADAGEAELPGSFSMRDNYPVSPVKSQTPYGTCWAHSAIASAESSVIRSNMTVDLSEFHTAYYGALSDTDFVTDKAAVNELLNSGGSVLAVTNLWAQWIGPADESVMPYGDMTAFEDSGELEEMRGKCAYHLRNAYSFDYDRERTNEAEINSLIKQFVYDGHAVDVSFYSDAVKNYSSEFASSNTYRKPRFANHSVAIVGWDDSFPKENFANPAARDGAWLVKNSWGANYGNDGYIWISFCDRSLTEFAVLELGDKEDYTELFQHDTYPQLQSLSAYDDIDEIRPSYMANVFTADKDTQIAAIGTYIVAPDTEYEITVYTDLSDADDPSSGKASSVTKGSCGYTGYMTLDLDSCVEVSAGETFSAVVKLYCADTPFVVPLETAMYVTNDENGEISSLGSYTTYDGILASTNAGESFYSTDGAEWVDVVSDDMVYTYEEQQELLAAVKDELYDGLEETDTEELKEADMVYADMEKLFSEGTVAIKSGNISMKVFGRETGAVGFSHISGAVPAGERVELISPDGGDVYYSTGGEYRMYTEPIEITETVTLRAATSPDGSGCISQRSFCPEKPELYYIKYVTSDGTGVTNKKDVGYRAGQGEVLLTVPEDTVDVYLYTDSFGEVSCSKNAVISSEKIRIPVSRAAASAEITVSREGLADNTIKVRVIGDAYKLGDADGSGMVDAKDASLVLVHYSSQSTGGAGAVSDEMEPYSDYNGDGDIDARDASSILAYYSLMSTR
ncbi:MAG: hypothetical protein J6U16_01190 [Ruminococcus sp.]|nr:hypothetical protein [Ruminococcus sp.]